jgi:molybdenum cofactor biosynthesis enzyme MoaA
MCNIWRSPSDLPEFSAAEWLSLLDSPLLARLKELDITGGEPFLRSDLPELLVGMARLKGETLPQLRSIAITTNGFLTRQILGRIAELEQEHFDALA